VLVALERHRRVAIVGPHGTGKSTLLAALADTLAADRRPAEVVRLRRLRDALLLLGAVGRGADDATLLVDGWERLGRPMALFITAIARLRGRRMVVTTHRANGMPVAVRTAGTLRLLTAIVARLPDHDALITGDDLSDAFARHGENLRDALGDLYDRYELRSRRS
jgi:energy-coupling factor transporter ATP-binding protein EcfA2